MARESKALFLATLGLMATSCSDLPIEVESSTSDSGTTVASSSTTTTTTTTTTTQGSLDTTLGQSSSTTDPDGTSTGTGSTSTGMGSTSTGMGSSSSGMGSTSTGMGSSSSGMGSSSTGMGSTSTGMGSSSTGMGSSSSSSGTGSSSSGGDDFQFAPNAPADYVPVDRVGGVGNNTLLQLLGNRDAYNVGTPLEDAALVFLGDFAESLDTWHYGVMGMQVVDNTGIHDDLLALAIAPCAAPQDAMPTCLDQIGPLAIPEALGIDLTQAAGYPNGRLLTDPVMDLLLALIWIDLTVHDATLFLDLDSDGIPGPSLNPLTNDVPFGAAFPHLAPPH